MSDSGRWDVQAEDAHGDARVAIGSSGAMGPAYAYRRFTDSDGVESYPDWQQRVTTDLFDARRALLAQGFDPAAFAVPGGDLGQHSTNDPRIPDFTRALIQTQFGVPFVRDARNYPPYTRPGGWAARLEIGRTTTADRLYAWLRAKDPAR